MKKIYTTFFLVISLLIFSQQKAFEFTKNGLNNFIVTNVENKSKAEIYTQTYGWILKNYKNPDQVINSKIENEYIKIEGIQPNLLCLKSNLCTDVKYTLTFSFKDNKYKVEILNIEQKMPELGWVHFTGLEDGKFYFEDNGELKSKFKLYQELPKFFNNLNSSIADYISGKNSENW